jgi:Tfp pilus assembly protein PilN
MTMIRINLIAEKKASAPKAAKKSTAASGQLAELQEYAILLVLILIAAAVGYWHHSTVKERVRQTRVKEAQLKQEYETLKIWEERKLEYEVQKLILNEKIEKISQLKDNREGPVKLLEDIANVLPESVWLDSLQQGYDTTLVQSSQSYTESFKPDTGRLPSIHLVKVTGRARTSEAITSFAKNVINLSERYSGTDLNTITQDAESGIHEFQLFFTVSTAPKDKGSSGS